MQPWRSVGFWDCDSLILKCHGRQLAQEQVQPTVWDCDSFDLKVPWSPVGHATTACKALAEEEGRSGGGRCHVMQPGPGEARRRVSLSTARPAVSHFATLRYATCPPTDLNTSKSRGLYVDIIPFCAPRRVVNGSPCTAMKTEDLIFSRCRR